jgi:hypothetical protein
MYIHDMICALFCTHLAPVKRGPHPVQRLAEYVEEREADAGDGAGLEEGVVEEGDEEACVCVRLCVYVYKGGGDEIVCGRVSGWVCGWEDADLEEGEVEGDEEACVCMCVCPSHHITPQSSPTLNPSLHEHHQMSSHRITYRGRRCAGRGGGGCSG